MERYLTYREGCTLAFAEYGNRDGFPILVQHGLIASIEDVDLFAPLLKKKTRLICIARPGYGRSSPYLMRSYAEWAEIVALVVDRWGLDRFDILAMSSGAPYGYSIGHRGGDQVRNIFIFSGVPALYDAIVRSSWPYPIVPDATMADLQKLARALFFSNLAREDLDRNDIRDSLTNDCFGVAQDLRLRARDWEFSLSEVRANVIMRHSKTDESVPYGSAVRTAELLANCRLTLAESGPHFSPEALDRFIIDEMSQYYE